MSFFKINEGGVQRADGTSIQIKHPEYLEYANGGCVANVSIGFNPVTREIIVYASDVDFCQTQNGLIPLSDEIRQQMVLDLREGLQLLKGSFVVL